MKVGSLVECVNDHFEFIADFELTPIKGKIYTVRELDEEDAIWLEEIVNKPALYLDGFAEVSFYIQRFRELLPPIANIEEHINENTLELEPCY